ncbi:MAG: carbohydrate porin [Planctomycetota bacterium]|nr:carbohydrate porin [Planctomycetota bacterium]
MAYRLSASALLVGLVCADVLAQATTQPGSAPATQPTARTGSDSLLDRETLTDNWFGLGRAFSDQGLSARFTATQVFQRNVRGGLSTNTDRGWFSGRYDLEAEADMDRIARIPGGRVYALARGSWSGGIDEPSVGSLLNVNNVPFGDEPIVLWQLYYEQSLLNKKVRVRVGKIDLTNCLDCCESKSCFDGNSFANDETCQFLNKSLVNNPTIPFPDPGLGALIHVELLEGWYVAAAVADADAEATRTGFNTAFHGPANTFSIYEMGVLPRFASANGTLQGGYRVGLWYDPQAKDRFGGGVKRDDLGFYASCDQMLWRPTDKKDDSRGLGVFGRYGIADADVSEVKSFWSTGLQYRGLIPTRDKDVMSFGVGQGLLSRQAGFTRSKETVLEWFYNIEITPWLHVAPDVQYIFNPGGDASARDAVVVGMRVQVSF